MADQLSATHAVPPANPQVGTGRLPIDTSPMRQTNPWDADRRSVELKQVDADCLVLEPKKWAAFWHVPLLLAAVLGPVAGLAYMLFEEINGNAGLVGVLILVIGSLLMLALLFSGIVAPRGFHRWVRFDRRAELMTISRRPFGFRGELQVIRSRPLRDIVCIQLLYAGRQHDIIEIGEPGTPGSVIYKNYRSYQLNLVMNDSEEPRLNLCSHCDVKWMREAGQRLAGFLGVELIAQLPQDH